MCQCFFCVSGSSSLITFQTAQVKLIFALDFSTTVFETIVRHITYSGHVMKVGVQSVKKDFQGVIGKLRNVAGNWSLSIRVVVGSGRTGAPPQY